MSNTATALYKALHKKRAYTKLYWDIANVIGINEALLIEVVERWCQINEEKGQAYYFHEGEWWTSASYKQWEEMYPALGSDRKIQRAFLKLTEENYILSCQPNRKQGNPTKYYRVNAEAIGELLLNGKSQGGLVPNLDEGLVPNLDEVNDNLALTLVPNLDEQYIEDQINRSDQLIRSVIPPTPHRGNESEPTSTVEIVEEEVSPPPLQEEISQLILFTGNTDSGLDRSSGHVATKQKQQVDYQPLIDLYNEYKPALWRKSSLTPDRERSLKQLFNLHKEALAEKMIDALKWAESDEFWSGRKNVKSGSKKKFDIDTLTRDGRVQKWAEYLADDGQSLSPENQKLAEAYAHVSNALNSTGGFFDD